MKAIRQLSVILFFSFLANHALAQAEGKLKMNLNYNVGIPVGSFKTDYVSKSSFSGAGGEIAYWFNSGTALGLRLGYQSYYEKFPRQTYKTSNNETISAVLSNTVEVLPVMLSGTFVPLSKTAYTIQPYISAGAGLNLVNYRQYFGEFSNGVASTSFAAQAGAGVMIPFGKSRASSFQVGASYNYAPYNRNGLNNLNTVGINAGLTFPIK